MTEAVTALSRSLMSCHDCSLLVKALRALGLVYIEHQARI